jgi:hypothetical protein
MDFVGAMVVPAEDDWVLYGEAREGGEGVPLDAVAIALRSIRSGQEPPGIDIRPEAGEAGTADSGRQKVTYYGDVERTIVGAWFFGFDYWMKRASMVRVRVPISRLIPYWDRAVQELQREVASCRSEGTRRIVRHNRYWLCPDEFEGLEDGRVLALNATGLRVLTEKIDDGRSPGATDPCTSRGSDDPLAVEFAAALTASLGELDRDLPVSQIANFAKLRALFEWLRQVHPRAAARFWVDEYRTSSARTQRFVDTEVVEERRSHPVLGSRGPAIHEHHFRLSGGVVVPVRMKLFGDAGGSLEGLYQSILAARPDPSSRLWTFSFMEGARR